MHCIPNPHSHHIHLLNIRYPILSPHRTFTKKQVSIEHSTTTLLTALSSSTTNNNPLSYEKAHNLSLFAKHQGFSVIGTWTREDCLLIGERLVEEGLDCRVIPYNSALPSEGNKLDVDVGSNSSNVGTSSSSSSSSFSSDYLLSLSS